jgi:competence protein ComEC
VIRFLAPFPLVRVLIPFVCGIIIADILRWNFVFTFIGIPLALAAVIAFHLVLRKSSRYYSVQGIALTLMFILCGAATLQFHQKRFSEQVSAIQTEVPVAVTITGDPETHNNNVRTKAHVYAMQVDSVWIPVDADIMIYIKRNPASELLRYGDQLAVTAGVQEPMAPMNPGEFDYRGWLRDQGIGFVCFAKNDWQKTGEEPPSVLKQYALKLRHYFSERMKVAGLSGQELAVSEALLLGKSNEIDPNLLASYSASGTLHVLSVSGMHVALLFVVLLKLLEPLEKRRNGKLISYGIQFLVIWFYAFMTGMSPSVLRAVMMLSVIIFGKILYRKAHLLNTLAASALILLVIDPLLIRNAGFLLSYAAVAGIVIGVPIIDPLFEPKNRITRAIWDITAVTIAAQLFTFPLGLYLFQQFPTWFLITNLIIIPLSTVCLYAGLLFLSVSWWTFGATMYAGLFGGLIAFLNWVVAFTEYLPDAVIQTASWSIPEILILYLLIGAVLVSITYKKRYMWILSGGTFCWLIAIIFIDNSERSDSRQITIYHLSKGFAIGKRDGEEATVYVSEKAAEDPEQIDYHVLPDYKNYGIYDPIVEKSVDRKQNILTIDDRQFWVGRGQKNDTVLSAVNYLLIHDYNARDTMLIRTVKCDSIVLSGGLKEKQVELWEKQSLRCGIPIVNTARTGSFTLSK